MILESQIIDDSIPAVFVIITSLQECEAEAHFYPLFNSTFVIGDSLEGIY